MLEQNQDQKQSINVILSEVISGDQRGVLEDVQAVNNIMCHNVFGQQ